MSKVAKGRFDLAKDLFTDLCFSQFEGRYDKVDTTDILPGSAKLNITKTNNESDASPAYSLALKITKQQLVVFFTKLGVITTPYAESLLMRETGTDKLSEPEQALLEFVRQTDKGHPQPLKMYTQTTTTGFTSTEEVTVNEYIEQCLLNFGKDKDVEQHKAKLEETLTPILGFPTKPDGLNTEWGAFYERAQTVEYFGSEKNYNLALYEVLIRNMPCKSVPMEVNYYIYNTLTNPSFGFIASFQNAAKSKTPMKIQLTFDRELVFPYTFKLKVVSQKKEITVLQDKGKKLEEIYDVGDSNGTKVNNRDENNASVALGFGGKKITVAKLKMAYTQKLEDFAKVVHWPIVTSYLDMNSVSESDVQSVFESPETGSIKISTSVNNNVCNEISNFEIDQYYKFHDCKNTERNMCVNAAFQGYYTLEARLKAVSVGSLMKKQSEFEYFQNYDNEVCVFNVDKIDGDWLSFQSTMEIEDNTTTTHAFADIVENSHADFVKTRAPDLSTYYNTFSEIEVNDKLNLDATADKYLNQIRETKTLFASELQLTEIEDKVLTFQSENFIKIPRPDNQFLVTPTKQYRIDFLRKQIAFQSYAFYSHQLYFEYVDKLYVEGQLIDVETNSDKFELKRGNTTLILDMLKGTTEIVKTDDPTVLVEQLWRCWTTNHQDKEMAKHLFGEVFKIVKNMQASLAAFFGTILAKENPFDNPITFLNQMGLPPFAFNPIMSGYNPKYWPVLAMLAWASGHALKFSDRELSNELTILFGYVFHSVCLFFKVYETICVMWEVIKDSFPLEQQDKAYNECMERTLFSTWRPIFNRTLDITFPGTTIQCTVFDYNALYNGFAANDALKKAITDTATHPAVALQTWARQVNTDHAKEKAGPLILDALAFLQKTVDDDMMKMFTVFRDFFGDGGPFTKEIAASYKEMNGEITGMFKESTIVDTIMKDPVTLVKSFKSRDHALKSNTEVAKALFTRKTGERKTIDVNNKTRKLDRQSQARVKRKIIPTTLLTKTKPAGKRTLKLKTSKDPPPKPPKPVGAPAAAAPAPAPAAPAGSGARGAAPADGAGGVAAAASVAVPIGFVGAESKSDIANHKTGLPLNLKFVAGTPLGIKLTAYTDNNIFSAANGMGSDASYYGLYGSLIRQANDKMLTTGDYRIFNTDEPLAKDTTFKVNVLRTKTLNSIKLKYIVKDDELLNYLLEACVGIFIFKTTTTIANKNLLKDILKNPVFENFTLGVIFKLFGLYWGKMWQDKQKVGKSERFIMCIQLTEKIMSGGYNNEVIKTVNCLKQAAVQLKFQGSKEQVVDKAYTIYPKIRTMRAGFANTTELEISEGSSPKNGVTGILANFKTFSLLNGNSSSESDGEDDSGSDSEKEENSAPADIGLAATSDSGSGKEKEENSAPADIASSDLGSDSDSEEESITAADLEEDKKKEAEDNVAAANSATDENQFIKFSKPRNNSSSSSGSDSEEA